MTTTSQTDVPESSEGLSVVRSLPRQCRPGPIGLYESIYESQPLTHMTREMLNSSASGTRHIPLVLLCGIGPVCTLVRKARRVE